MTSVCYKSMWYVEGWSHGMVNYGMMFVIMYYGLNKKFVVIYFIAKGGVSYCFLCVKFEYSGDDVLLLCFFLNGGDLKKIPLIGVKVKFGGLLY